MAEDCLFCKIIEGSVSSTKVFESDSVFAFKDIQPKAKIHYLFVPKKHYDRLDQISAAEMYVIQEIFTAIHEVVHRENLVDSGFRIQINNGEGGGQEVFHLHVHLLANP